MLVIGRSRRYDALGRHALGGERGFSLLETLVSVSLMMVVTAAIFGVMHPSQGTFQAQPETADVQQRLRVAADVLSKELIMAGGGSYLGQVAGSLSYFFAPVLPYRQGLRNDDPPGTFKTDTITLIYVKPGGGQTTIAQPMPAQSSELKVTAEPGCPVGDALCGFEPGMTVLIFDETGSYDTFTITAVQTPALHLQHDLDDLSKSYATGSKIVEATSRTFFLKADPATDTFQLMQYDGGSGNDVPVVDHVVGLAFEYFGEPQPPLMRRPLSDPTGPWTTYGPKPPAPGVQPTAYPPGENCVFRSDGSPTPAPRLEVLGGGAQTLVPLTAAQLTDGPWCPDAVNPNRFDADLYRIRKVGVVLRVESAVAALRGPAGPLFTRGGTSPGGNRFVPDQEVRFQISPRNLNLGR